MSEPFRMSRQELKMLNEDGFVVRENVFSAGECRRMAADVEQLERDCLAAKRNSKVVYGSYMFEIQRELQLAVKWEPDNPDVVQGIEPFAHISKPLRDWAYDLRLWNPSKDVVGQDELGLFTEKTTMKRARTGGTIVLHQDYPYWRSMTKIAHKITTALIYLDDATVENGCLEVSPGSHRDGMRMDRKMVDGFGSNELDEAKFETHTLIPVEAKAGTTTWTMPASEWLCAPVQGRLYGGAIAMLAGTAIDGTVQTTLPAGAAFGPVDLKVYFLRPVSPDGRDLVARGTVIHRGRSMAIGTSDVFDADGKKVAVATGSAVILPGRPATVTTELTLPDPAGSEG